MAAGFERRNLETTSVFWVLLVLKVTGILPDDGTGNAKAELFKLYQRFRLNALICDRLLSASRRADWRIKAGTLVCITLALLSQTVTAFQGKEFSLVWSLVGVASTILSIISMVVTGPAKQHHWFETGTRFKESANELEMFSSHVTRGRVDEDELLQKWGRFRERLDHLLERAGADLVEYHNKYHSILSKDLEMILRSEGKIP